MKKTVFLRTAAIILAAVLLYPVHAAAVCAEHAILLDGHTGKVLYEKQADQQSLIASTTKIMTGLIICEQCNVLDRVCVPKEAVGIEGSSMYLKENEVLTVQDLLYGMMLNSGNDAAVALAIYCGKSIEGFAKLMNEKARDLGLSNTHFVNPNGLDAPGHYSSARDLAILASYAMQNPIFAKTVSTKQVKAADHYLTNHNKLLWQLDGTDGVKTGYTKAAGRILVSSVTRNGRRLICVTINDGDDWADHKALHNNGFSRFQNKQNVKKGQTMGTITVFGGQKEKVTLLAADDFFFSIAEGEEIRLLLPKKDFAYAPVICDADAGFAYVCIDGAVVGKIPLQYGETVEQQVPEKKSFWERWIGGK